MLKPRGRLVLLAILAIFSAVLAAGPAWSASSAAATPSPAGATEAPAIPETLTTGEVRDVVSRLSDEEVRALLIQQLDKLAAAEADRQAATPDDQFEALLANARERVIGVVGALPNVAALDDIVVDTLSEGRGHGTFALILLTAGLIFAAAGVTEWGFRRLFAQFGTDLIAGERPSVIDRLCILGMRLVRDVLAIAVFGAAAAALFFAVQGGSQPIRVFMANAFWGIIAFRLIAAALRFGLAPFAPSLRIPDLTDATARAIYGRGRLAAGTVVFGYCLGKVLLAYVVDPGLDLLVSFTIILAVVLVLIGLVWRDRRAVGQTILGEMGGDASGSGVRGIAAYNWHVFVSGFLLVMAFLAIGQLLTTGEPAGHQIIATLVILVAVPAVDWLLRVAVCRLLRIPGPIAGDTGGGTASAVAAVADGAGDLPLDPAASRTGTERNAYYDVLVKNLRIVLGVLVVSAVAEVWRLDLKVAAARTVGDTLSAGLFDIIITLILASAAWGIIRVAIRSAVAPAEAEEEGEATEAGEIGGKGKSRLETLLPLLGKFLMVALIVIVGLIILSELGVDIGPLIAGAGVFGLAIGFGAQTLVRDIISGLFFLLDDAFRVGEYVDIGSVRGMVEHISIRSLRLRHHNGPLHTVPFGEIQFLTNFSRDWAIMKLELRVPFDTDLEKVRKLIKKTGQEMMADPEHGPNFLQPLKSQGVNRMDDSAFIVRVKFMAKPGEQFVLRREVFRRIQEAFAANGIQFAPRRVIVDTGGGDMTPAAAAAVAAAAAAAGDADASDRAPDDEGHNP